MGTENKDPYQINTIELYVGSSLWLAAREAMDFCEKGRVAEANSVLGVSPDINLPFVHTEWNGKMHNTILLGPISLLHDAVWRATFTAIHVDMAAVEIDGGPFFARIDRDPDSGQCRIVLVGEGHYENNDKPILERYNPGLFVECNKKPS